MKLKLPEHHDSVVFSLLQKTLGAKCVYLTWEPGPDLEGLFWNGIFHVYCLWMISRSNLLNLQANFLFQVCFPLSEGCFSSPHSPWAFTCHHVFRNTDCSCFIHLSFGVLPSFSCLQPSWPEFFYPYTCQMQAISILSHSVFPLLLSA